jgi:hypothetical protein
MISRSCRDRADVRAPTQAGRLRLDNDHRHMPAAGTYLWRTPGCQGGASSLSLLVFVRPQLGSGAGGGRRVSDRIATLDAGEDGRTMCGEDDALSGAAHGDLRAVRRRDSGWWSAAGARTYLGARTPMLMRPVTRGLMGCPAGRCSGAAARSIEGRPAGGWRAVPVWELAVPARGVLGGGLVRRHDHHHRSRG